MNLKWSGRSPFDAAPERQAHETSVTPNFV